MNFLQNIFQHKENVTGNFQRQACVKGTNIRIGIVNPNVENSMIGFCSENLKPFCGPYNIFSDIIQEDATNFVFLLGAVRDGKLVTLLPDKDNKSSGKQLHFKTYGSDTQEPTQTQKSTLWHRLSQPGQRRMQDLAAKRQARQEKDALRIMIDSDCIRERMITKNLTPDRKLSIIKSSARHRVPWEYYTVDNHYIKKSIILMHKSTPVTTSRTSETKTIENGEMEQESVESCPISARPAFSENTKTKLFDLFGTIQSSSLQQENPTTENVEQVANPDTRIMNDEEEVEELKSERKDSNGETDDTDCQACQSDKSLNTAFIVPNSPTFSMASKIDSESSGQESVSSEKLNTILLSLIKNAESPLNVDIRTDVDIQSQGEQVLKFMAVNDNMKVPFQVVSNSGDCARKDSDSESTVSSIATDLIDNLFHAIYYDPSNVSASDTDSFTRNDRRNTTFTIERMPSNPIQKKSRESEVPHLKPVLEKCNTSELCISTSSLVSHSTNSITQNDNDRIPSSETIEMKHQESQTEFRDASKSIEMKHKESQTEFHEDFTLRSENIHDKCITSKQYGSTVDNMLSNTDINETIDKKLQELQTKLNEDLTFDSENDVDKCNASQQHNSTSDMMSTSKSMEFTLQKLETIVIEDLSLDQEKIREECGTSTPTISVANHSTEAITDTTFTIEEISQDNEPICMEASHESTTGPKHDTLHLEKSRAAYYELMYPEISKETASTKESPQNESIKPGGDVDETLLSVALTRRDSVTAVKCTQTENAYFMKQHCVTMLLGENFSKNAAKIKNDLQGSRKSIGASFAKPEQEHAPWWIRLSNAKSPPMKRCESRVQSRINRSSIRGTDSSPLAKSDTQGKTYRVLNSKITTE